MNKMLKKGSLNRNDIEVTTRKKCVKLLEDKKASILSDKDFEKNGFKKKSSVKGFNIYIKITGDKEFYLSYSTKRNVMSLRYKLFSMKECGYSNIFTHLLIKNKIELSLLNRFSDYRF